MLLMVWPFGQLPYLWALAAWSLLWLAFYLWASVGWRTDATILVLALLLAPASYINISGGQNGFLTGALLIGGLRLLGPKPILAGICFGLLTVKPQLGILLPFALLASRQWTAIVVASVTAALLVGASALLFGWESWQAYAELVVPHQAVIMNERHGVFLVMMPFAYMALQLSQSEPFLRFAVHAAFSIVALAGDRKSTRLNSSH